MFELDISSIFTLTNCLLMFSIVLTSLLLLFNIINIKFISEYNEHDQPDDLIDKNIHQPNLNKPSIYVDDKDFRWNSDNYNCIRDILSNIVNDIFHEAIDEKYNEYIKDESIPQHILESISDVIESNEEKICKISEYQLDYAIAIYICRLVVESGVTKNIQDLVNISFETAIRLAKQGYYAKEECLSDETIEEITNEVINEQFGSTSSDEEVFNEYA